MTTRTTTVSLDALALRLGLLLGVLPALLLLSGAKRCGPHANA